MFHKDTVEIQIAAKNAIESVKDNYLGKEYPLKIQSRHQSSRISMHDVAKTFQCSASQNDATRNEDTLWENQEIADTLCVKSVSTLFDQQ